MIYSINNRKQANKLIIKKIQSYLKKHPELRFNQMLFNLGIVTEDADFYIESEETLNKLRNIEEREKQWL